jgi:hypothetical protein
MPVEPASVKRLPPEICMQLIAHQRQSPKPDSPKRLTFGPFVLRCLLFCNFDGQFALEVFGNNHAFGSMPPGCGQHPNFPRRIARPTCRTIDFSLGYTPVTASPLHSCSELFAPVSIRSRSAQSPLSCILLNLSERS